LNKTAKKILIKTKRAVFSEIIGNNPSIFKGEGYDFLELREYEIGDDVKKIDWIISAKLQKPYVKVFHEERELNIVVVSILNGSVYFGTKRLKQELIAEISSIIGYSCVKNQDLFNQFIFADRLYSYQKPSKKLFSVKKAVDDIVNFNSIGKGVDSKNIVETLNKMLKRKSLIFVVSDFFEPIDLKILNRKHEVFGIMVRDRFEENPKEFGFLNLIDPQNGKTLEGSFSKSAIKRYKKSILERDSKVYRNFKESRIRFTKIYTDEEPFIKLTKLFNG